MILRHDARYSLTRLLPVPTITTDNNRHAFIWLFALIQHALLFLKHDNKDPKYTNLIQSVSAQTIINQAKQNIDKNLYAVTSITFKYPCWNNIISLYKGSLARMLF